jgi:valyl-tRNA synthetase
VSSSATVFLLVKGHVDIDNEIAKSKGKLEKVRAAVEKQTEVLLLPEYGQKASKEVQETDRKKLADLEMEANALVETVRQFEEIKLKE